MALNSGDPPQPNPPIVLSPRLPGRLSRFTGSARQHFSAWAAGTAATLLAMAAEWLDLALHGPS